MKVVCQKVKHFPSKSMLVKLFFHNEMIKKEHLPKAVAFSGFDRGILLHFATKDISNGNEPWEHFVSNQKN